MPSKVALTQQVKDLTQKLKDATETIHMGGKMVEIPLTPEGKVVAFPKRDEALHKLDEYKILQTHDDGDLTVKSGDKIYVVTTEGKIFEEKSNPGNPISCATELKKIESDIASGKTYWDITEEQYERWRRGEDTCLPCERSYTETKSALTGVGIAYSRLIHPEDIKIADIAASVRLETGRDIFAAEQDIKELGAKCGIKFPKVRSRLTKMKPLAHIGRWDEFMEHQGQLLTDFELDLKETIPDLEIRIPSYAVPRYVAIPEYEKIKASLPEEQRKELERREKEERKARIPARWAAYECPYCPLRFETIGKMHTHIETAHKPYKCPHCPKEFYSLEERIEHIWEKHRGKIKIPVEGGA